MKKAAIKILSTFLVIMLSVSCVEKKPIVLDNTPIADIVLPQDPKIIKTSKGAQTLDLESPLRCNVNWNTQEMVLNIPYNVTAFNMVRNGNNDILPRFEVTGFSFETMPAEKALLKLTKEAGIKLIAKDAPYPSISAENLRGEFADVVNMITEAAEIFYTYDAKRKVIRISRRANFSLFVPKSRTIAIGFLDVLRGAGITDITTDWEDYSITFDADFELKQKIMKLIAYFEENPILIAFDVSVFRIYPKNTESDVNWQGLLDAFNFGTVKTTKTGVIGRVLTTSNDLNINTLRQFLGSQATVMQVTEGKFVVPNLWLSRFDIGKCARTTDLEAKLSILGKASLEQNNKIFSTITLETRDGQITNFDIRSRLGENFLIIGIPNEIFGVEAPKSETVVFMVPRIIRTAKTTKHLQNNF